MILNELISINLINNTNIMYPQSRQGQFKNEPRLQTGLRAPTGYKATRQLQQKTSYTPFMVERPVTHGGMMGMKTDVADPKRKILSRSYFAVLIKKKNEELTNEIARFREEIEKSGKEREVYKQVEKRREELYEEVKELEGQLADYNLAMDKHRAGAKASDLLGVQQHISFQNARLRTQVDAVFTERKNYEEKLTQAEYQIRKLKEFADIKINELSAQEREEYRQLVLQVKEAESALKLRETKLSEVDRRLMEAESKLRADLNRQRYFQLKEAVERFDAKRGELEEKLADASLGFEDLRKKLMEKVKKDKTSITILEKKAKEGRKLLDNTTRRLQRLEEGGFSDEQKQKFAVLYEKEKEINEYLNSFINLRAKRIEELGELELNNLRLLELITKNKNLVKHAPSQNDFDDLAKEMNFKKQQAENSETTLKKVQHELLRRQEDLAKVDEIEETLPDRINQLREIVSRLDIEINIFEDKEGERDKLLKRIDNLKKRTDIINKCMGDLKSQYEQAENEYKDKLKELERHDLFKKFVGLEKQLSQVHQLHFNIYNYIKTKEDETDFEPFVKELEDLTSQINATLIK